MTVETQKDLDVNVPPSKDDASEVSPRSDEKFPLLLSPLTIRGKSLRNRIVSTPHATGWDTPGGTLVQAEVDYHVRKAAGGCGLVMTFGSASVDPETAASYGAIALWDPRNEPALRALADGVHRHGSFVMSQLTHMGRRGDSRKSGIPVRGPSDIPEPEHREVPVPLTTAEIKRIVTRFVDVAKRLEACGWDGAEITSFGHLIEQFWDPKINNRTDEYGGSLENRMRFGMEVVEAVRAAVSENFIVGFRMTIDQRSGTDEVGLNPRELAEIAVRMANTSHIDVLSLTGGAAMTKQALANAMGSDFVPEVPFGELAASIRSQIQIPVILAGRILDGQHAEGAIRDYGVDLVGMTRAMIADPDLGNKLASGQRIRPCIGINQGCIGRLYNGLPVRCSVNPAIREPQLGTLLPAPRAKNVIVVGAGVSGLEAARSAALRGHKVVVLDRGPKAGGRASINAEHGWRPTWQRYLDFLIEEAADAGVDVRYGIEATAEEILALSPDEVILATGSRLREALLPEGALQVHDADEIIVQAPAPAGAGTAVVIDEENGFCGPTAAVALAEKGWNVVIATPLQMVAGDVDGTVLPFVHRKLETAKPTILVNMRLHAADHQSVTVENVLTSTQTVIPDVGLLVVAGHRQGTHALAQQLAAKAPSLSVHLVGDALSPRGFDDATAEGARMGAAV
ncbi:FAD-dependent oxidoreductase [Sinomonas mesophila]|uniref:FAD-dependent oxidoreductase n=1 Tax=Sinomonas mesophila TaxID=1531955 RepID=UPI0009848827|nr:FAD-dependent oxidoreductase [Sinomonas mesophila]